MSSGKCRPSCVGLNVLSYVPAVTNFTADHISIVGTKGIVAHGAPFPVIIHFYTTFVRGSTIHQTKFWKYRPLVMLRECQVVSNNRNSTVCSTVILSNNKENTSSALLALCEGIQYPISIQTTGGPGWRHQMETFSHVTGRIVNAKISWTHPGTNLLGLNFIDGIAKIQLASLVR